MRLKRTQKSKIEWLERVVAIERVTKVVKGGKKMSFRAIIVVGNEQGKVGVGVGNGRGWEFLNGPSSKRYGISIKASF